MSFKYIPPTGHKIYFKDIFRSPEKDPLQGFLLNSGTAALYFLLANLNIPPDSNVVIPAYTCPSVAAAVIGAGHKPVLCDLHLDSLAMDIARLQSVIHQTDAKAVVWVNLFGLHHQIPRLEVPVISDDAQSEPFAVNGRNIAGCIFSFGRGKPVNSLGGGAAIVTDPDAFGNYQDFYRHICEHSSASRFRYFLQLGAFKLFFHPVLYKIPVSIPGLHLGETRFEAEFDVSPMSEINKNCARNIFARFSEIKSFRLRICGRYRNVLSGFRKKLLLFGKSGFYRYPVVLKQEGLRGQILQALQAKGIGASTLYPAPLNRQQGLANILQDDQNYPNAEYLSKNLLTLPVNEFIRWKEIEVVKQVFDQFLK